MTPGVLAGVRAVVFDAVGTLIHPAPPAERVYADVARAAGLAADPADVLARFRAAFRAEEEADRGLGWVTDESREAERWRQIVAASLPGSGEAVFRRLFEHFGRPDAWAVDPDAPAALDGLAARGIAVGIGSNFDARLDGVLAGRPELAAVGRRVVISSRAGVRKPHPGFFRAVAAAVGCEPAAVLFVGDDRANDFDGPLAAGFRAVLLDPRARHPAARPRLARLGGLLLCDGETAV